MRALRRITLLKILAIAALLVAGSFSQAAQTTTSSAGGAWRNFQGTWIASGSRTTMGLGGDRRASIANYDGSLVLKGPSRPAAGFRAQAMLFNDSKTGIVGRAVWTDDRGDQAFSELRGESTGSQTKLVGTFVGGTGRYSGATGTYQFSWRFLIETDDGTVQGQSTGLTGRIRIGSSQSTSDVGALRS